MTALTVGIEGLKQSDVGNSWDSLHGIGYLLGELEIVLRMRSGAG